MATDDQVLGEVRATLKKVRAAKGRLQGNFYWTGDTRCAEAHVYVTLSTKDRKGTKALAKGKELRKSVKGAKFGRGLVRMAGGKLLFELHTGTASASLVKKSFTRVLSKLDGLTYLKQAVVLTPSDDEEAAITEQAPAPGEAPVVDDLALDADEAAELERDIAEQAPIVDELNAQLSEVFLSAADGETAAAELIAASLEIIALLEAADPVPEDQLQAERAALAESLWSGPDPFPEPGQALSPEIQAVLRGALDENARALLASMDRSAKRIAEIHAFALDATDEEREEQAASMLADLRAHRAAYQEHATQLEAIRA